MSPAAQCLEYRERRTSDAAIAVPPARCLDEEPAHHGWLRKAGKVVAVYTLGPCASAFILCGDGSALARTRRNPGCLQQTGVKFQLRVVSEARERGRRGVAPALGRSHQCQPVGLVPGWEIYPVFGDRWKECERFVGASSHMGVSSVRRHHDRRPDPLGTPSRLGHARLRHIMSGWQFRYDRRPRPRAHPRLGSGVHRHPKRTPHTAPRRLIHHRPDESRRRSRAAGLSIDTAPRPGIPIPAP